MSIAARSLPCITCWQFILRITISSFVHLCSCFSKTKRNQRNLNCCRLQYIRNVSGIEMVLKKMYNVIFYPILIRNINGNLSVSIEMPSMLKFRLRFFSILKRKRRTLTSPLRSGSIHPPQFVSVVTNKTFLCQSCYSMLRAAIVHQMVQILDLGERIKRE